MNRRCLPLILLGFTFAWSLTASETAETGGARIVQYMHDGDEMTTRVLVTSFGGPVMASVSITDGERSQDFMVEIAAEDFERIWNGFETIEILRNSEITDAPDSDDTVTHHVFFTQEESAAGSKGRSFGLAHADATADFLEWLRLFVPEETIED